MKLAIVGTRELSGGTFVAEAVRTLLAQYTEYDMVGIFTEPPKITEVVSGGARGVDRLAEHYAEEIGVPCKVFEPKNGPAGGRQTLSVKMMMDARNQEIVNYADMMVAIRLPGQSPGTDDAIKRMKAAGKPVMVFALSIELKEFANGNDSSAPG